MESDRKLAFGIITLVVLVIIVFIAWQFSKLPKLPEEVRVKPKEKIPSAQTFEIIRESPRDPQIIEVEVDPIGVELGKTQLVIAKIKTKADSIGPEDFVLGKAICDQKAIEFPLKLKKAEGKEEMIVTWQGEWKRECQIEKNYQLEILAKNIKGEDRVTLSFK